MQKMIVLLFSFLIFTAEKPALVITGTVYDDQGNALPGVSVVEKKTANGTVTDTDGRYTLHVTDEKSILVFSFIGYANEEEQVGSRRKIDVILQPDIAELSEVVIAGYGGRGILKRSGGVARSRSIAPADGMAPPYYHESDQAFHTEAYDAIEENIFHKSLDKPLSTFSIDVDAASYSNIRRFLNMGQLPPKDAVRIEEMINYFRYDYDGPTSDDPFAIHTAYTKAPWNDEHLLVKIGIQGRRIETDRLPPSNIVFLIDVSGSMNSPNKLPLLKSSLKMLTNELRPQDKISIVVYAGAAGLVLPPTDGNNKQKVLAALESLQAGGSTAGGAGIRLAYEVAKQNFVAGGNNRVILATDGDFNVGVSSNAEMQRLIEEKREGGIFLTVLGFGMGNYKDSKMETLADKGNGNYAYIDNIMEAKKVLVTEFGGTLFTIAKDVKIQVEFNPTVVQAYRLIGYENRKLRDEDFNDDKKDAGELGSGHTVTALYEIIPAGVKSPFVKEVDPLKYQDNRVTPSGTGELLTVKFRYKDPDGIQSKLITRALPYREGTFATDKNLDWAATIAGFGMLLRDSEYKGTLTYDQVLTLARASQGKDEYGYRAELIRLVEIAGKLQ